MNEYFAICHSSANIVTDQRSLMFKHLESGDLFLLNLQSCGQNLVCGNVPRERLPLMTEPISTDPQKSTPKPLGHSGGLAGHQGVLLNLHVMEKGHKTALNLVGLKTGIFRLIYT